MKFLISFRYGTIYREVMKIDKINVCFALKNGEKNVLLVLLIQMIKEMEPSIIHPCPYTDFLIRNKTVSLKSVPSILPRGDYRITGNLTNNKEEMIVFVELLALVVSSETNTFG